VGSGSPTQPLILVAGVFGVHANSGEFGEKAMLQLFPLTLQDS